MNKKVLVIIWGIAIILISCHQKTQISPVENDNSSSVYPMDEGYIDSKGVMLYFKAMGKGEPLVILHGGPGASHDYFLPYLLPLMKNNRLIFMDERGSGRSQKISDSTAYTLENMAEDVEAVRKALNLGKINLLGHSCGGVLAQTYALKYQQNLQHLILCSTFSSTVKMNEVFVNIKKKMSPELLSRIENLEKAGLFGHGRDYEKNRYPAAYMAAAWGEGYFPYLYQRHPDANYDPIANGNMAWDVYRVMWGSHGEFVIDGNLKSAEYTQQLAGIKVPTLITVGDHDECDPALSREMQKQIAGSKLVVLPQSGHMTFVDQQDLFIAAVDSFLRAKK